MGINIKSILVILIVGLVLFGTKKLPDIGKALGKALHDFRRATVDLDDTDVTSTAKEKEKQDAPREG